MNSDLGIDIKLGAEVQDCNINQNHQLNNVSYSLNGQIYSLNCDWLIHATGQWQNFTKFTFEKSGDRGFRSFHIGSMGTLPESRRLRLSGK